MTDQGTSRGVTGGGEHPGGKTLQSFAARSRPWLLMAAIFAAAIAGVYVTASLRQRVEPPEAEAKKSAVGLETEAPVPQSSDEPAGQATEESEVTPPGRAAANALENEAVEVVRGLLDTLPRSPAPVALMGTVYARFDKVDEAAKWWKKCLEMDPRRADVYVAMADVASRKGQYEEAVKLYRNALKIRAVLPDVHRKTGRALMRLGKIKEAVAALAKELRLAPRHAQSHGLLGQAYRQLGEFEQAKKHYEIAIEIRPKYTEAYYGLATVCTRLQQTEKSQQYMQQFKKLKTEDHQAELDRTLRRQDLAFERQLVGLAYTEAGRIFQRHGYVWRAEKHWLRAAELDPKNHICRRELASLYTRNRQYGQAVAIYQQLTKTYPQNATYHLQLGVLHAQMNRRDAALAAIQQALELDPDDARYRQIYQEINQRK